MKLFGKLFPAKAVSHSESYPYAQWDRSDFTLPPEFVLDGGRTLADSLRVFYAAGGYDFFKVVDPDRYSPKWLEFMGKLYESILSDDLPKGDGHFTFPLSESERKSLIEQGVPPVFTSDL